MILSGMSSASLFQNSQSKYGYLYFQFLNSTPYFMFPFLTYVNKILNHHIFFLIQIYLTPCIENMNSY